MLVSDFDFELPPELIAQQPPAQRGQSRMLAMNRQRGVLQDLWFNDLPQLLREGDVLVLNDSRVIPARLFGIRAGKSGVNRVEVLLTERLSEWEWRALTRPARRMAIGQSVAFTTADGNELLEATVSASGEFGERQLRFTPVDDFFGRLEQLGHVPLPPYIRRQDQALDRERYQTVFARQPGSVAAATAGLHFTPEVLERIRARGVIVSHLTLHVGLGTFQPVRVAEVAEIQLHAERYSLPEGTAQEVNRALHEGRRVVAAGTTTVRVLEHCARIRRLEPHSGINQHLSFSGVSLSRRVGPAYEFSLAPVDAANAGQRFCRKRKHTRCLSVCCSGRVPLLLLRRLHVHWLTIRSPKTFPWDTR